MDRMHKLMSYYLPTTLKLVESYERFDKISAPGPDIIKAKTPDKRHDSLCRMAGAFEQPVPGQRI